LVLVQFGQTNLIFFATGAASEAGLAAADWVDRFATGAAGAMVAVGPGMAKIAPHLHLAFLPAKESLTEWDAAQFEQVTWIAIGFH
jgi:hypothetical protein